MAEQLVSRRFSDVKITPSLLFSQNIGAKMDELKIINQMYLDGKSAGKGKGKKKMKEEELKKAVNANEEIRHDVNHSKDLNELAGEFQTHLEKGLTEERASEVFKRDGPNELEEKKGLPWYCLFLKEMTGFFALLLWFGCLLCFIGYALDSSDPSNLYLGIVLGTVVFITGCFSYYQTSKSASLMAKFKNFIPPKANVIRGARQTQLNASELVVGDIILVNNGDKIPADIRVIKCSEMKVDNSSLTGESDHLLRKETPTHENVLETANFAFFGTKCVNGNGTGLVCGTGARTVMGKIAHLAQSAQSEETTLSLEIKRFIKIVSAVAIFLGVTFFVAGIIYEYGIITDLVFAIGIIVANVPEGLLATVTVSLALTAKKMASKQVLVKNLEAVETLGSTSCICSDKTGTLTQNVMTVSHTWIDGKSYDCALNIEDFLEKSKNKGKVDQYEDEELGYSFMVPSFRKLLQIISLSTKALFIDRPTGDEIKRKVGDMLKKKAKNVSEEEERIHRSSAQDKLIEEERLKKWSKKRTQGDASESGLIKFIQGSFTHLKHVLDLKMAAHDDEFMEFISGHIELSKLQEIEEKESTSKEDYLAKCLEAFDLDAIRLRCPLNKINNVDSEIAFNSINKYNLMIRKIYDNRGVFKHHMLIMKGAPERIWGKCSHVLVNGSFAPRDSKWKKLFKKINKDLGDKGERVLAFATLDLPIESYPEDYPFDPNAEEKNFPMDNLNFIGIMSLNDPPRVGVERSVLQCKEAGIKVIMVTGDQPVTAKAIAIKCKLITDPDLEKDFDTLLEQGMSEEEALKKCTSICIHGDRLAERNAAEEDKDDKDPGKGKFLMDWLTVPEVVFARTTPSQKLLIVNGCQKLQHIVAVTGDGVNDSPAIKKANIGIAMGSGADVAKDAADMLLLNDDFTSIVNGIKEGRLIFDNLKKSIAYTLSSNIPEIAPFLFFIIFQVPLPLSTVLILCIDLGTDMVPAISLAYENPELDIMERRPRNAQMDHLVNAKLISFSYLQVGIVQASAGFYTYFVVMSDYGFSPSHLFFFALREGCVGNEALRQYKWTNNQDSDLDIRKFYANCPRVSWDEPYKKYSYYRKESDTRDTISSVSDAEIRYTSEALRYAQCSYLISIIIVQWADILICKTRKLSIAQQGMRNHMLNFGLCFETGLGALLCYVPWVQRPLGTRPLEIRHFGIPSFPFFIVIFFYDELRKFALRRKNKNEYDYEGEEQEKLIPEHATSLQKDADKNWIYRNTYY